MAENNSFLGFLKNIGSSSKTIAEEEKLQRNYALAKSKSSEEAENTEDTKGTEGTEETDSGESKVPNEITDFCIEKLNEILELSKIGGKAELQGINNNKVTLEIMNSDDVGRLIGKDGSTLESLQILIKSFVFKKFSFSIHLTLDVENYRERRKEALKSQALKAAKIVMEENKPINLKPMSGDERRIIHIIFKNHQSVKSHSIGVGKDRHIVLSKRNS
ncbi:protein jag [Candidatus Margulisiibacteriota bacterium]